MLMKTNSSSLIHISRYIHWVTSDVIMLCPSVSSEFVLYNLKWNVKWIEYAFMYNWTRISTVLFVLWHLINTPICIAITVAQSKLGSFSLLWLGSVTTTTTLMHCPAWTLVKVTGWWYVRAGWLCWKRRTPSQCGHSTPQLYTGIHTQLVGISEHAVHCVIISTTILRVHSTLLWGVGSYGGSLMEVSKHYLRQLCTNKLNK